MMSEPRLVPDAAPLPSLDEEVLGEAVNSEGDTKIEVLLRPGPGSSTLELVEYSWGSGLGWYPRKRLTLDTEQAAALAAILQQPLTPAGPSKPRLRPLVERDGNVLRLLFPAAPSRLSEGSEGSEG